MLIDKSLFKFFVIQKLNATHFTYNANHDWNWARIVNEVRHIFLGFFLIFGAFISKLCFYVIFKK